MARPSKTKKRQGRKTCSIIVDGETEIWYFQLMKQEEQLRFDISPEIPQKKTIEQQYEVVCENAKIYDRVYWILDLDVIVKECRESASKKQTTLEKLKSYIKVIERNKKISLLVNNPCLEYWFLLHLKNTAKYYPSCNDVIKELKRQPVLRDYCKSERYFKKQAENIYTKLKPYQKQAVQNAKSLADFDCGQLQRSYAELYKIIDNVLDEKKK